MFATRKRFWSLSRKQYYAESGINKRNKLKALRYWISYFHNYRFKQAQQVWQV